MGHSALMVHRLLSLQAMRCGHHYVYDGLLTSLLEYYCIMLHCMDLGMFIYLAYGFVSMIYGMLQCQPLQQQIINYYKPGNTFISLVSNTS